MLISSQKTKELSVKSSSSSSVFCSGLFLSARWFVLTQVARNGIHLVVLPDKESAEYCAADLYNLVEGDRVFFLTGTGKNLERSNYRATLRVQRTSALDSIVRGDASEKPLFVVSYPQALAEEVPDRESFRKSLLKLTVGEEISRDRIGEILFKNGFEKVDFVSEPGQFALRGGIVDIFSYSFNNPFRISLFGDEIDSIGVFDANTQLSVRNEKSVDIYPDVVSGSETLRMVPVTEVLPENCLVWMDSSDVYKDEAFVRGLEKFRRVYLDVPLGCPQENAVKFDIVPQPVFNKNFELRTEDIRNRLENG